MNHRIFSVVFALAVGLGLAWYAYDRATDPLPRQQRAVEERVVLDARSLLKRLVAPATELEIVDPLAPNRVAGKVYVYPAGDGWDISGHYRRGAEDRWHPWLMRLDAKGTMVSLKLSEADTGMATLGVADPRIEQGATPD